MKSITVNGSKIKEWLGKGTVETYFSELIENEKLYKICENGDVYFKTDTKEFLIGDIGERLSEEDKNFLGFPHL